MKVLYISYGGLGEVERIRFREYVKKGVKIDVVVPSIIKVNKVYSSSGYLAYDAKDAEDGFAFIPVDLIKPGLINSFNLFQLFKVVKNSRPDIIHVYDDFSSYHVTEAILCRNLVYGKKVPIIVHTLQNIHYKERPFFPEFSIKGFKLLLNNIIQPFLFFYHNKNVAGVTSVSKDGLDVVKAVGFKGPLKHIYSGTSKKNFYNKDRDICRKELGILENEKIIGYVGRLVETKGLNILIEALSKMPDWKLMLLGSGHSWDNYEEKLDKLIEKLSLNERVYKIGSVDNKKLVDYYNAFDVFVLPSQTYGLWKEQGSLALTEAMFCQCKIVGSSSGAIPEMLKDYPLHYIFKERDTDDLAEKIKKAHSLKMPENFDIEKVLSVHTAENFAVAHIDFYKSILKNDK